MKIQHLAVIFIIIIMPIVIVFSEYMNTQIKFINLEETYDKRLLNSTYDAIKAFQLNTIKSFRHSAETRVDNAEYACNTFLNSIASSFKYEGYESGVMKEYVPAIVVTMYDGYYIYTPFKNLLTDVNPASVDTRYTNGKTITGLKPYISYSCLYDDPNSSKEYIITYSLENYIVVDVFDSSVNNYHERHEGYILQGIKKRNENEYEYDNIVINNEDTEQLKEYLYYDGKVEEYHYTIRNGTKFYYGKINNEGKIIGPGEYFLNHEIDEDYDVIFYLDDSGERIKQVYNYKNNTGAFNTYFNEIKENNLGFSYYKSAYEFTKWVKDNLGNIKTDHIVNSANYDGYEFEHIENIFGMDDDGGVCIQDYNSNFNRHKRDLIRAVIQTNLSTAISGYSSYSNNGSEFIMPKISESDWELLENNICIAAFMQGLPIGNNKYNSYSVVPNNYNKEYIGEEDIYIIKNDNTYARPNEKDTLLNNDTIKKDLGYFPGMLKINFEAISNSEKNYYTLCYYKTDEDTYKPYLKSYASLISNNGLNSITYTDMYRYMRNNTNTNINDVKKAYYIALGRERMGSFKFTNY